MDKNFGFFDRYFAEKSDLGKHGKENCKENSTARKIGKKSGKSAIFRRKIEKFRFFDLYIDRALHALGGALLEGKGSDLSPIK